MAEEVGLLSLPNNLLAKVAHKTEQFDDVEKLRQWARASTTCRRFSELQLSGCPIIKSWNSLEWHLRRFQHAKRVWIHINRWPGNPDKLQELSRRLVKVSCNLRELDWLEIWPILPRTCAHLSSWISCMLAGASSLDGARLGVDMLKRLPLSRRKLLGWLDLDAYYTCHEAIVNCLKALTDCQQLKSFSLKCTHPYWGPIELDLRHLVRLSHCKLYFLPVPSSLLLPQCRLELVLFNHQIAAWSKLWPQVQHHVCCIEVGGDSYLTSRADSALQLGAWPEAIGTFHGLQFLQIICREVSPYLGQGVFDLALVAYIPHVSLRSEGDLHVIVSGGSWDLLELQSKGAFDVVIADAEAFMKSTCAFYFTYTRKERPQDLIQMMWAAAIATGNALYEDDDTYSPLS